jgi:hypothetical protein
MDVLKESLRDDRISMKITEMTEMLFVWPSKTTWEEVYNNSSHEVTRQLAGCVLIIQHKSREERRRRWERRTVCFHGSMTATKPVFDMHKTYSFMQSVSSHKYSRRHNKTVIVL